MPDPEQIDAPRTCDRNGLEANPESPGLMMACPTDTINRKRSTSRTQMEGGPRNAFKALCMNHVRRAQSNRDAQPRHEYPTTPSASSVPTSGKTYMTFGLWVVCCACINCFAISGDQYCQSGGSGTSPTWLPVFRYPDTITTSVAVRIKTNIGVSQLSAPRWSFL